jgi:chromosome segregation ATPase
MNSAYRDAIRQPLNMAMLILSIIAGLVSAWWLLPIGLIVWFVMVRGVATHPVTQVQSVQPARPEVVARFQSAVERIEAGQLRALSAIGETKRPLRQALDPLQTEIKRLVDTAHRVAQRAAPLESQRKTRAKLDGDLPHEIATADRQLAEFTDDAIKRHLAKSRATMQARLDSLQALIDQLNRIEAELADAADALDQTAAGIDRLRAGKSDQVADEVTALTTRLQEPAKRLAELLRTVNNS